LEERADVHGGSRYEEESMGVACRPMATDSSDAGTGKVKKTVLEMHEKS